MTYLYYILLIITIIFTIDLIILLIKGPILKDSILEENVFKTKLLNKEIVTQQIFVNPEYVYSESSFKEYILTISIDGSIVDIEVTQEDYHTYNINDFVQIKRLIVDRYYRKCLLLKIITFDFNSSSSTKRFYSLKRD